MFNKIAAAALISCLLPHAAVADIRTYTVEFNDPETISPENNMIKIKIKGWGSDWAKITKLYRGKKDEHRNIYTISSSINYKGYGGEINFGETIFDHSYSDDTLTNRINRHPFFAKRQNLMGKYGTITNGAAEYKYMTFISSTEDKPALSCALFTANWRNYFSYGVLCNQASVIEVTEPVIRDFIRSIGFKNELDPTEATLPQPGDSQG